MADGFREFNQMMASSPDLARAFAEYAARPEEAPPVERFLMLASWRALFYAWSGAHRQHLNGTLDPLLFQAVRQEISTYSHRSGTEGLSEDVALRQRVGPGPASASSSAPTSRRSWTSFWVRNDEGWTEAVREWLTGC